MSDPESAYMRSHTRDWKWPNVAFGFKMTPSLRHKIVTHAKEQSCMVFAPAVSKPHRKDPEDALYAITAMNEFAPSYT